MSTDIKSLTKNARMSPKKVREITRVIQGLPASEALDMVNLIPRKSARLVAKTLKSAIANAENNKNLSSDALIVSSAVVELGPVLRRFKAGAKGSAMPRRRKMSHIRIVLSEAAAK
jgi:large subunit ribosomal protein L22